MFHCVNHASQQWPRRYVLRSRRRSTEFSSAYTIDHIPCPCYLLSLFLRSGTQQVPSRESKDNDLNIASTIGSSAMKRPENRTGDSNPHKAAYFDRLAEEWDAQTPRDSRQLQYIVGLLGLGHGQAVLDVGTGTGVLIPYLLEAVGVSGSVLAVDYSAGMIAVARQKYPQDKYPNVRFEVQDINEMPMDCEYDAILCYSCFPHFEDQRATVEHLARGLRSRGRLMVAHSESREAINKLHMESSEDVHNDFLPPMIDIRRMMHGAGLRALKEIDGTTIFLIIAERSE
jgi:ubiquinone/menaquinone biosynthesis C-methylase UbiE